MMGETSRLANVKNTQRNKKCLLSAQTGSIRVRVVLFYNGLFEVTELFVKRTQQKTLLI